MNQRRRWSRWPNRCSRWPSTCLSTRRLECMAGPQWCTAQAEASPQSSIPNPQASEYG
jgi:hypothetical protein